MRILIVSDTWLGQVNGVIRTYEATIRQLKALGHDVEFLSPDVNRWCCAFMPTYPEIKLEFFARDRIKRKMEQFSPDAVHIATEGPLGWAARRICLDQNRGFTTAYHTHFPEFVGVRVFPLLRKAIRALTYALLRRFHAPSCAVMVATASLETTLRQHGFQNMVRWSRGVDTNLFIPSNGPSTLYAGLEGPILLYVGRVSIEKNLEAFLSAKIKGTKVIVGDGPDLESLKHAFPKARFLGAMTGKNLAVHYAAADLFVFPSKSDTFGLVLLEAAASGLRIASYPAPGPADIFADPTTSSFAELDDDLTKAIIDALALPKDSSLPRRFAECFSWQASTVQFLQHLHPDTQISKT